MTSASARPERRSLSVDSVTPYALAPFLWVIPEAAASNTYVREDAPVDDTVLFQVLCSSGCTELFILAASPNENEQFFKILQSNDTSADLGWAKPHAFEDFMGEDEIIIWLQGNLQSFVLLILPVNDKKPYWDNLPLQISVEEGFVGEVPGVSNEYWIKALDDDFGDNGSLSYSLSHYNGKERHSEHTPRSLLREDRYGLFRGDVYNVPAYYTCGSLSSLEGR
ncbi:unnamed protein product [Darwinula stevensoni]|uniref:Uncharacterized protein n=1 Tax=Darwinula stevensoni TaxID=69355 RepID=A0A7R9FSW7_9CRUS|nr:unnamed protein product [Darwinula stevensoni]CAG0904393.1 unnamed protein product [Darwinula stevensoni]